MNGEPVAVIGVLQKDEEFGYTIVPRGDQEVPVSIEAEQKKGDDGEPAPIKLEGDLAKYSEMVQITDAEAVAKRGSSMTSFSPPSS